MTKISAKLFIDSLHRQLLLDEIQNKSFISRALNLIISEYSNKKVKNTHELYVSHPIRVSLKVASVINNDVVIVAALLHDLLENTKITSQQIEKEFGMPVERIVKNMTLKDKSLSWKERDQYILNKLDSMDEWSLIVLTADYIDNLNSLYCTYLKKGEEASSNLIVTLYEQRDFYKLIHEVLEIQFKKYELWSNNSLLEDLKNTIQDIRL